MFIKSNNVNAGSARKWPVNCSRSLGTRIHYHPKAQTRRGNKTLNKPSVNFSPQHNSAPWSVPRATLSVPALFWAMQHMANNPKQCMQIRQISQTVESNRFEIWSDNTVQIRENNRYKLFKL